MGRVFPREWEQFVGGVAPTDRDGDLAAAYSRLLHDPDAEVRAGAAAAWCAWEDTHVGTYPVTSRTRATPTRRSGCASPAS